MRRLRVALGVVLLVVFAACGDEPEPASGPASLKYVPSDALAVAVVPTDLAGEQLRRLDALIRPALRDGDERDLRGAIASVFEGSEIQFARDIEPLLGEDAVVAAWGDVEEPRMLLALATDGERAQATLRRMRLPAAEARVDGDTLLFDIGGVPGTLDAALANREGFDAAALEGDEDSLLRLAGDPRPAIQLLGVQADQPWIEALQTANLSIKLEGDAITARARVATRPDGLSDEDLPLETGDEAPEAGDVDGAMSSANRNQSRTTVFLAQLARRAYPDSEFVTQVEAVEADLGISFEDEVLKQFNGPSASVATPDGQFAAVSDLADPERMRALLPELAPRLPAILRGLQGLGNSGLVALLLIAPDAPLVPGALPLLQDGIGAQRIPGGDLYELTGLDEGDRAFAVQRVVFGMIGDRFVVATDEARARAVAEMDVSAVPNAEGAAVARTDLSTWDTAPLGLETVPLGEGVGELEASLEGIEARLRIDVPGGLD